MKLHNFKTMFRSWNFKSQFYIDIKISYSYLEHGEEEVNFNIGKASPKKVIICACFWIRYELEWNIVDKDLIRMIRTMHSNLFSDVLWTYFLKFSRISSYVTNPSSAAANLIAFSTSTPLWKMKQNRNFNLKIFHNAN